MAAERVTPAAINLWRRTRADDLRAVAWNAPRRWNSRRWCSIARTRGTAYTVTVDSREGTTGISAQDQAVTICALVSADGASDLLRPGHVTRCAPGRRVLARAGHTEAAVDLARLAGLQPAGVICEIKTADGSMARLPALQEFAVRFGLRIITVADLISYRRRTEKLISLEARVRLPTPWGQFAAYGYECQLDHKPYVALVMGDISEGDILVRVHSSCLTGDVFHSLRCDCGEQLNARWR